MCLTKSEVEKVVGEEAQVYRGRLRKIYKGDRTK